MTLGPSVFLALTAVAVIGPAALHARRRRQSRYRLEADVPTIPPDEGRRLPRWLTPVILGSAVGMGVLVMPWVAPAVAVVWWSAPRWHRRNRRHRRQRAVHRQLPDVIDLLALALAGGASVRQAVDAVAVDDDGPVTMAFAAVSGRIRRGESVADALAWLAGAVGEEIRPAVEVLVDHDGLGAPARTSLERLSDEARSTRRTLTARHARRLPVLLLFPLVLCILPAFVLLTVVPLLAGTFRGLSFAG